MYEEKESSRVAVRETQIARETLQMVGLIENLFKVTEALEMRLESVLLTGGMKDRPSNPISTQQAPTVGLAIALADRNNQLMRLREKLEDLHGRIEL